MLKFLQLNPNKIPQEFFELNEDFLIWIVKKVKELYGLNLVTILGKSIPKYVDNMIKDLKLFIPPYGIYYLLSLNHAIIGMGALKRMNDSIGEIKRMYIEPKYRGNGFGKQILQKLIKTSKKFGYEFLRLDSGNFMEKAHKIYESAGFELIDQYPESEVPKELKKYWRYMEMKL